MKWIKRLLLLAACLLVMLLVVSAGSYYMLRRAPEWYDRPRLSLELQQAAAARAEAQFSRVEDFAAALRADEARHQHAIKTGTAVPASLEQGPITVQLSEDELNAVFKKWSVTGGWDQDIAQYVTDPTLVLQPDRLILAGKLRGVDIILSSYFAPSIDDQGLLHVDMVRVLGGKLPLPDVLFSSYRQKLLSTINRDLPFWQRQAGIDRHGVPNPSLLYAATAKMLLASMNHTPCEPVIFLPLLLDKGTVPVRIDSISITQGKIELTLAPLTESEREALVKAIKQ
jgi:hypothetical protein